MKQPTDEKRQRMDEHSIGRPPSVPVSNHGHGSPPRSHSSFDHEANARRQTEEQRSANENYHPSEAAHHPQSLPAMISSQPIPSPQLQQMPRMSEAVKEEPRIVHEPAARRMDVDENYDDDEDEKRPGPVGPGSNTSNERRESPKVLQEA